MGLACAKKIGLAFSLSAASLALLTGCVYPQHVLLPPTPRPSLVSSSSSTAPSDSIPTSPARTISPTRQYATQVIPSPTLPIQASSTPASQRQIPAAYNLDAVFDYTQHHLAVSQTITYKNLTGDRLSNLILVVEPNLASGGFLLESVTWQDGLIIDGYDLSGNLMQIPLHQTLSPGDVVVVKINYRLQLPELTDEVTEDRPVAYGYSALQTNLVDWYPFIPPYIAGEGWLVHPTWSLGEYLVYDVADFDVSITLAEPVPGLMIAASAPAIQNGDRYEYHLDSARTFALSVSTDYLLQSTVVGDVTVYSYFFPYDKSAGQEVLSNTADALQQFYQLIGRYPHSTLTVVEADFLDGMEYDGLFFLSHGFYDLYDGTPKGYLTFIAAHETAHQWWYGLVGNDQALEPWLDETLSTYMEYVFYENLYSDYPPGSGENLVDWWWFYRVNFYDPGGWVDSPIYEFDQSRSYRDAIYLNGARFMDDLRNLIGDQAFFAALRDYADQNTGRIAARSDFFAVLRRHTSQDLEGLISTYFQIPE